MDWGLSPGSTECQKISPALGGQKTRTTQRQEVLCHHQVLRDGEHALGKLWTSQLSQQAAQDLQKVNTVLPGLDAQFRAAQPNEQAQLQQ